MHEWSMTIGLCALASLIGCTSVAAEMGEPIPDHKKLIGFAVNSVEPAYLKEHIVELEQKMPLDGLIVFVYPDDWGRRRTGQEDLFFGGRRFRREDFSKALADLKATRFKRYTDNFIQFATSARGSAVTGKAEHGNLDWFDPNWSVIAENGAVLAGVAKEAGLKGFFLDVEYYRGSVGPWEGNIFDYGARPDKDKRSMAQVEAQVRRRGREWMQAVVAAYPDITIVIIQNTGWGRINMVEPFVKGMLAGRGRATLVDGGESGYHLITHSQFAALREGAQGRHRTDKLFGPVQYAFGVWVDRLPNEYGGWHTDPADFDRNFRNPLELERTLYGALTAADRYVWLYVWHPRVWFATHVPQRNQCVLCPHKKVPDAYVQALIDCRKPHDLDWTPAVPAGRFVYFDDAVMVEGRKIDADTPNLLKNAGLENWSQGPDEAPDGWIIRGEGTRIRRQETAAKSGRYSARLTTVHLRGHVLLDQHIPAAPYAGKTIALGAWVRTDMKDIGTVHIVDFVGGVHETAVPDNGGHPGDGKWHFLTATKTIRRDATGKIYLSLQAQIPFLKAAWIDP